MAAQTKWWHRGLAILLSLSLLWLGGCDLRGDRSQETIQLTLWHGVNPPPNRDIFQNLVDRFNQTHPKIQVESLYIGQPDRQLPKILTAVVGDAPPDLLWFPPMLAGKLVELGAIVPLDDWLDRSGLKAQIDPSLIDGMTLNGRTWSVPMATNNVGIFYRPSRFEAAGITELPQTWEQLRQCSRQLSFDEDGDGGNDRYGMLLSLGKSEWVVFTWLSFLYSAGGELVEDGQLDLYSNAAIAALQFWSDLVREDIAILSPPERGYELDDFISGRVAMQITGPWTLGQLSQLDIDYDVMPMPRRQERATVAGGENLFVMKTRPDRQQAALEFLEYILSQEFQTEWALGTGYLPINLKARQSPTYQQFVAEQPVLDVFLEQMKWARSRPNLPGYPRLSESLGRAIEAVLLGTPPKAAIEAARARLDLILGNE